MRNILALVGFVVVAFVAIGYSRGWYSFALSPGSDGKKHIAVDVDTRKIKNDGETAADKVGDLAESFRNRNAGSAAVPPTPLPGPQK